MISNIAVLGLGLMGGSLWRRLAAEGHQVNGYDMDPVTRAEARRVASAMHNRLADRISDTVAGAVVGTNLVVIAVSTVDVPGVMKSLSQVGYRGIITDVTSIKQPLLDLANETYPGARWVGGHPMIGFERQGFFDSHAHLYDDTFWMLCLDAASKSSSALVDWLAVAQLLTSIGVRVIPTTAPEHDLALARISHVPHLVASAVTKVTADGIPGRLSLALGKNSFRNVTEPATTPPARTADFVAANRAATYQELGNIIEELKEARKRLASREPIGALQDWLEPMTDTRTAWPVPLGPPETVTASVNDLLRLGRDGGYVTGVQTGTVTAARPMW